MGLTVCLALGNVKRNLALGKSNLQLDIPSAIFGGSKGAGNMPMNPDVVIAKANELKEAREHVAELEAELKALVMDGEDSDRYSQVVQLSELMNPAPMNDKIVALLERNSDRVFYFKEIYKTIGGNEASVRSTIAKLINENKIQRLGWGKYQALQKERLKAG
jgi:hypothetical protein